MKTIAFTDDQFSTVLFGLHLAVQRHNDNIALARVQKWSQIERALTISRDCIQEIITSLESL
jgi:hypothetical protein